MIFFLSIVYGNEMWLWTNPRRIHANESNFTSLTSLTGNNVIRVFLSAPLRNRALNNPKAARGEFCTNKFRSNCWYFSSQGPNNCDVYKCDSMQSSFRGLCGSNARSKKRLLTVVQVQQRYADVSRREFECDPWCYTYICSFSPKAKDSSAAHTREKSWMKHIWFLIFSFRLARRIPLQNFAAHEAFCSTVSSHVRPA